MRHNFSAMIYFSVVAVKYENEYQSLAASGVVCIPKTEHEMWEEVLKNRELEAYEIENRKKKQEDGKEVRPSNGQMKEQDMWGTMYSPQEYGMSNEYSKVDHTKVVVPNYLYAVPCYPDSNFDIRLILEPKHEFLGVCSFPLTQISRFPKIRHELDVELVDFGTLRGMEDKAKKLKRQSNYNQRESRAELKQLPKIARISLTMVYVERSYGKLVFRMFKVTPLWSHQTEQMNLDLIVRVDNKEIKSSSYKVRLNSYDFTWPKDVEFEFQLEQIPKKVTLSLFNKETEEREGIANIPIFQSNLLLPTKQPANCEIKMFTEESDNDNAKIVASVSLYHQFLPFSIE